MNITPHSRVALVDRVLHDGWPVTAAANAFAVSPRTVYKWVARLRAEGRAGLEDRRSIAHRRLHAAATAWLELIRLMRAGKLVAADVARQLPLARSTVSAVLGRMALGPQFREVLTSSPWERADAEIR